MTADEIEQLADKWMRLYPEVCAVIHQKMAAQKPRRLLTGNQKTVLTFVAAHIEQHGFAPSLREIAAHLGHKTPAAAHGVVKRLIEAGYLHKDHKFHRSLRLI